MSHYCDKTCKHPEPPSAAEAELSRIRTLLSDELGKMIAGWLAIPREEEVEKV